MKCGAPSQPPPTTFALADPRRRAAGPLNPANRKRLRLFLRCLHQARP